MTLTDLSKLTMDALQMCCEEDIEPDDVIVTSGDSFDDGKQIHQIMMRVGQNDNGDERIAICFITDND